MKQRFSNYMRYYERSLIFILMLFSVSVIQAQNRTLKGTVTDAQGEPIIGANVVIVGGTKGVITDLDGKYSIQIPESGAVLKFSYIGFKAKSFNVAKGKNVSYEMLPYHRFGKGKYEMLGRTYPMGDVLLSEEIKTYIQKQNEKWRKKECQS